MKPFINPAVLRELWRRFKSLFWLKIFGVPGFMMLFFWGYFQLLNSPCYAVTVMPLTAVDRIISYQPSVWLLYISLWLYVQFPLALIDTRRALFLYGWLAMGISLIGFAFFHFWPTAVPAVTAVDDGSVWARLRTLDTTGNSCPSLHVAFAVFTAAWLERVLCRVGGYGWLRLINGVWCVGIIYSTLATKQHVLLDAVAGALLGLAAAGVQAWVEKRYRAQAKAA